MKVSVVVPVYNIADCVKHCVESLACQNYDDFEIILVDDGSTDDSPELCDELAAKYDRIRVVHKSNGGLSSARNAGMDVATGTYVLFVDGDDYLANGAIATLVAVAEKSQADVVQFGYEEVHGYDGIDEAKRPVDTIDSEKPFQLVTNRHTFYSQLYALGGVCASGCTKLMRLSLAKSLRFKEGLLHEDEQFTTWLLAICHRIAYMMDYTPYKYVMREGSIIHAGFKAKRLYDTIAIQEERLECLRDQGFSDLLQVAATRYFGNIILQYLQAREAGDKDACRSIDQKALQLLKGYRLELQGQSLIIALCYKFGISGAGVYYRLRKLLGK